MHPKDKKSKKNTRALRHGKKLEAQKPLDIPIMHPTDSASVKPS